MRALREFGRRLMALLKLRRIEDEIDEEMRFHIEMTAKEKREEGLNADEALYAARRQFGNPVVLKERSWDAWGWAFWDRLIQDARHALRTIIRTPAQTLLIVITLGLAMGAVLAVFSLLDKLVMRPLPAEKPSELVFIRAFQPEPRKSLIDCIAVAGNRYACILDYPLFIYLRDQVHVFSGISAYLRAVGTLATSGDPVSVHGYLVTGNYFDMLGIKTQLGRTLTPADDLEPDGNPAVVLTYGFWQRQFGSDPSILNRTILLNKRPMVVAGITTPGFTGMDSGFTADFFIPLNQAGRAFWKISGFKYDSPGYDFYTVIARLAPGVDIKQAERATEKVYQRLLAESAPRVPLRPGEDNPYHVYLFPGGYASILPSDLIHDVKSPLRLLMAMVVLVLIVAAGNVANLLLARRTARARETAIRFALGSSRGRILRELLGESLLLSASAAILGYFLASWIAHLVPVLFDIPNLPAGVSTEMGSRSHLFAIALGLTIGICIWGASAIRATKRSLLPALIENATVGAAPRATQWRRGMVVLQISFSLILLCASCVLCRSLMNLMSVDPGFSVDNLYSFSVDYGQLGYKDAQEKILLTQIADRVHAIPGVRTVAMTDNAPMSGGANIRHINDRPIPNDDKGPRTILISIGPDYFKTMGIPLTAGREFAYEDKARSGKVAVVNESLAHILYGTSNPIGRRIWVGGESSDVEIVGLVKDIKGISLRDQNTPYLFIPISFDTTGESVNFLLRTSGPAITLNDINAAVKKVDSSLQVAGFGSVTDQVSKMLYRDRSLAMVSLCFAGLTSILCAIGIFGLTSYSIAGRTKEIGLRIALGANAGSIYRLVMREVVLLCIIGCTIGLAGFIAISRIFTSLIFQLKPTDPVSLVWAILVLGLTTFLAGFIPSRRATELDPSDALRWE
jgi:predicted permease